MLSMIMITAITAVALPQLRITTLSMMRSMSLAYVFGSVVFIGSSFASVSLFGNAIVNDMLASYGGFLLMVLLVVVLSYHSMPITGANGTPYSTTLMTVIIAIGAYYLVVSNDLLTFVIALEVQSFSLYALTSVYRWREGATSAGLMYFMLGAFSSGLAFLGIAMIYGYTGETGFDTLSGILSYSTMGSNLGTVGAIMLLSGILFKVTAAPFHHWGPEVYDRVPTVMTIFITIMPKVGLVAFIVRLTTALAPLGVNDMLVGIALASWAFGGTMGLVQSRVKRLLAYSTVSHVGWMLASVTVGTVLGYGATLFYLLQYSMTTGLTFLALIGVGTTIMAGSTGSYPTDIEAIRTLGGLSTRSFVMTAILAITLFSAAGIPPLVGFYGKLAVIQSLLYGSSQLVVFFGIVFSVVSAGYYLGLIATMLFQGARTS